MTADPTEAAWSALYAVLPSGWRVGGWRSHPDQGGYVAMAWPHAPTAARRSPGRAIHGQGPDEASAIAALTAKLLALE